ncbi:hypothetical protein R6Q59_003997 [Mikania micrantha]
MSLPELFSFQVPPPVSVDSVDSVGLSVNDARKILRFSQLQKVRSALKHIPMNSISYSEILTVCINTCNNDNQGLEFSKTLDQAGDVIVSSIRFHYILIYLHY